MNVMTLKQALEARQLPEVLEATYSGALLCPSLESCQERSNSESSSENDTRNKVVRWETETALVRTYRALSATIVADYIDYGYDGGRALMEGVKLFHKTKAGFNVPMHKNHSREVEDWLGKVTDSYWDSGEVAGRGFPAGVNIVTEYLKEAFISDTDKKILVGLQNDVLNAVSVTIRFNWKKSHPKMDDFDFMLALGTTVDGELVRVLVTKILQVLEISLVYAGADPYARDLTASQHGDGIQPNVTTPHKEVQPMEKLKELVASLATFLEISEFNVEDEAQLALLMPKLTEVSSKATEDATALQTLLDDTKAKLAETEAALTKSQTEVGEYKADLKERLTKATTLVMKDQNVVILKLAETADLSTLKELVNVYEAKSDEFAPLTCPSCHTTLTRQSAAVKSGEISGATTHAHGEIPSDEAISRAAAKSKFKKAK